MQLINFETKHQKKPLISVIVPIYNAETYLQKCINSILNQTYQNLEIILINDGSNDNSSHLCQINATKDERIKIINQINQGASAARNNGILNANGDFIAFVDSDDWIEPRMFETMMDFALSNNLKIVECEFVKFIKKIKRSKFSNINRIESKIEALERIINNQSFSVWRRIYASELLKGKKFKEGKMAEDVYFTSDIMESVNKIGFVPIPFYNYYIEDNNSVTRSKYSLKIMSDTMEAILYLQERICELNNKNLNILTDALVTKIAIYNYISLFSNPILDIQGNHRKKLKHIINKNFNHKNLNLKSIYSRLLPISIFGYLIKLKSSLRR